MRYFQEARRIDDGIGEGKKGTKMSTAQRALRVVRKVILCVPLLAVPSAQAATINAASCSQADIQIAIDSAATGDTVALPGGTCTWSSTVNIPNTKGIILNGGGATISGNIHVAQNTGAASRITQFNFVRNNTTSHSIDIDGSKTHAPFRVDGNTFTYNTGGSTIIELFGNAPGLIDHNIFSCPQNCEMIHNMGMGASDASGWSDDVLPGSSNAVYIEDNSFSNNGVSGNPAYFYGSSSVQSYYGARTVFRHNTLLMSQVDQHGTPGMIGARWWEIYENTFNTGVPNASQCCFISLRGGSGVVFHNHHTGANLNGNSIDLYEEDTGYPALYQIGRGKNQALDPAYVWGNDVFFSVGSQTPAMVQVNRDYYLAAKPSYTPFTYPYPLEANGLPDPYGGPPSAPVNLRIR